jgi:hypothetical protein
MKLSEVKFGPEKLFFTTKSFSVVEISLCRASSVLLSPCSMRSIRLVIALLHPRDELQHAFKRIRPQG